MDPTDFHKTAELLSKETEEAHIRTSINRSYYGLFLYVRGFLTANGIRLPDRKKKSHHQFVLQCIREARFFTNSAEDKRNPSGAARPKDNTILGIYRRLQTLLQHRTDADYKLHITFCPNDSQDSLRLATTTIQDFNSLSCEREKHILETAEAQSRLY